MTRRKHANDTERVRAWRRDNPGFGLTADDLASLIEVQGGVCAICGRHPKLGGRRLAIDHDHQTGRVRGLLCYRCNTAIGLLGDDPDVILRSMKYVAGKAS